MLEYRTGVTPGFAGLDPWQHGAPPRRRVRRPLCAIISRSENHLSGQVGGAVCVCAVCVCRLHVALNTRKRIAACGACMKRPAAAPDMAACAICGMRKGAWGLSTARKQRSPPTRPGACRPDGLHAAAWPAPERIPAPAHGGRRPSDRGPRGGAAPAAAAASASRRRGAASRGAAAAR